MEYKDYYAVLDVPRTASQDEIKRAYRKLARKYHPDVQSGPEAETRFREAGEAYEVLKDPEKRRAYDALGSDWQSGRDFRPPPGWDREFSFTREGGGDGFAGGAFGGGGGSAFSDFFETLFGHPGQRGPARGAARGFARPGSDRHARIEISLEDAFSGAERVLTLQEPQIGPGGDLAAQTRRVTVKIPKGITAGQQIRLRGKGSPGSSGGPPGDLLLEVAFTPHRLFRVEGRDLFLDLPVAPWEAALGARVPMPTPAGKVDITIPPNARAGQKLRLKGRGLPGKPPGSLYAVLQIALPPADTDAARAFYTRMAEELPFDPRAQMKR